MNKLFGLLLASSVALQPIAIPVPQNHPVMRLFPYKDKTLAVERRVEDLLSRMTVEEKIRQLDMYWGKEMATMKGHEALSWDPQKTAAMLGTSGAGSVHDLYPLTADAANDIQRYAMEKTRLGIPVLFIEEGLHGYSGLGSTSFPIPLQLSGAWDTVLLHDVGRAIATETRAHGVDMLLAPVLCLPRDPRWGRTEETYGEDTYLDARNGVAMVKGLQGAGVDQPDAVISEPKHFAVHGIPEAGSNTAPVNMGGREARSAFLYVFEKAVREGSALGMMAAYSELDGIPCVDNRWLLTDILRKEWGFKGFVLSDLGAIRMSLENHHTAATVPDALAQTIKAGLDMQFYDWPHPVFLQAMQTALQKGLLSTAQLNRAAGDVLRVKFLLALIGPLGTSTYLGGYSNTEGKAVSVPDGLRQRAGSSLSIHYEPGYSDSTTQDLMPAAIDAVKQADATVVVLGEEPAIVGEGKDRAHADILLGRISLSGKLPMTFPRSEGQIPFYYDHKPASGHRYVDEADTPLFCFGHGLAYTQFRYSALTVSPASTRPGGSADVAVTITNTGAVAGADVAQLYVRDVVASVTTPLLALKGFSRVTLNPGESRTVHFTLGPDALAVWNREMKRVVEPGEFKLMAGSSSADIRLTDSLLVKL